MLNKTISIHRQQLNAFLSLSVLACCSRPLAGTLWREARIHLLIKAAAFPLRSFFPPALIQHGSALGCGCPLPPLHILKKQVPPLVCVCVLQMKTGQRDSWKIEQQTRKKSPSNSKVCWVRSVFNLCEAELGKVRKGELDKGERKVGERNLSSPPQWAPVLLYSVLKMQAGPSAFLPNIKDL